MDSDEHAKYDKRTPGLRQNGKGKVLLVCVVKRITVLGV